MARSPSRKPKPVAVEDHPAAAPISIAAAAKPESHLFAVTRSRGPAWDPALPMEEQADWDAHAAFMDQLEREGFVVLAGPLEDTPYVMLAVRAESLQKVRAKLSEDPWEVARLIETTRIVGWTLRLGAGRI